jgi:predicted nucleic acid-binding Zn ribbon protein
MRYASKSKRLRHRLIADWRGLEDGPLNDCEAVGVDALLSRVLKEWKLDEKQRGEEITAAWRDVVGEFLAQHTAPDSIKRGILTVRVLHATVHHTLMMEKARLLARLQQRFGKSEIRDLKFRHG